MPLKGGGITPTSTVNSAASSIRTQVRHHPHNQLRQQSLFRNVRAKPASKLPATKQSPAATKVYLSESHATIGSPFDRQEKSSPPNNLLESVPSRPPFRTFLAGYIAALITLFGFKYFVPVTRLFVWLSRSTARSIISLTLRIFDNYRNNGLPSNYQVYQIDDDEEELRGSDVAFGLFLVTSGGFVLWKGWGILSRSVAKQCRRGAVTLKKSESLLLLDSNNRQEAEKEIALAKRSAISGAEEERDNPSKKGPISTSEAQTAQDAMPIKNSKLDSQLLRKAPQPSSDNQTCGAPSITVKKAIYKKNGSNSDPSPNAEGVVPLSCSPKPEPPPSFQFQHPEAPQSIPQIKHPKLPKTHHNVKNNPIEGEQDTEATCKESGIQETRQDDQQRKIELDALRRKLEAEAEAEEAARLEQELLEYEAEERERQERERLHDKLWQEERDRRKREREEKVKQQKEEQLLRKERERREREEKKREEELEQQRKAQAEADRIRREKEREEMKLRERQQAELNRKKLEIAQREREEIRLREQLRLESIHQKLEIARRKRQERERLMREQEEKERLERELRGHELAEKIKKAREELAKLQREEELRKQQEEELKKERMAMLRRQEAVEARNRGEELRLQREAAKKREQELRERIQQEIERQQALIKGREEKLRVARENERIARENEENLQRERERLEEEKIEREAAEEVAERNREEEERLGLKDIERALVEPPKQQAEEREIKESGESLNTQTPWPLIIKPSSSKKQSHYSTSPATAARVEINSATPIQRQPSPVKSSSIKLSPVEEPNFGLSTTPAHGGPSVSRFETKRGRKLPQRPPDPPPHSEPPPAPPRPPPHAYPPHSPPPPSNTMSSEPPPVPPKHVFTPQRSPRRSDISNNTSSSPRPDGRKVYSSLDPDKASLRAVAAYHKSTPIARLRPNYAGISEGLILRIAPDGLYIDDDINGVHHKEWDIKASNMKTMEIWCPSLGLEEVPHVPKKELDGNSKSKRVHSSSSISTTSEDGDGEDVASFLDELICSCLSICQEQGPQLAQPAESLLPGQQQQKQEAAIIDTHVMRAELRNGRKFVFLVEGEEAWKMSVGLQRMRKKAGLARVDKENSNPTTMAVAAGFNDWIAKGMRGEEAKKLIAELTKGE